jgi:hypothetical protein
MYSLHCGVSMGFETADPMLLPTFEEIWNLTKDKRLKQQANVKVFKVYENKKFKPKK